MRRADCDNNSRLRMLAHRRPIAAMLHRIGASLLAAALASCVVPGTATLPTPYPADYVPTAVYLTAIAIDAGTQTANPPTLTPTVTETPIPPTPAPTLTPTPGPQVPLAAIQVRSPGPMSRIVSPMLVQLLARAGDSNQIRIDLFGEDGRNLYSRLINVPGTSTGDTVSVRVSFDIRAAGENGFVQVSTKNGRGRIQSLITVPVLLLSDGVSQVNPPGNTIYERVALADLPPESEVSGGVLQITGEVLPVNNSPVIMELITEGGETLSVRVLNPAEGDWRDVSTTLPYRVGGPTEARLYVRQADQVIDGDAYIYSQLITLLP